MSEVILFPVFVYIMYELGKIGLCHGKLDDIVEEWEYKYNKRIDYYFRNR